MESPVQTAYPNNDTSPPLKRNVFHNSKRAYNNVFVTSIPRLVPLLTVQHRQKKEKKRIKFSIDRERSTRHELPPAKNKQRTKFENRTNRFRRNHPNVRTIQRERVPSLSCVTRATRALVEPSASRGRTGVASTTQLLLSRNGWDRGLVGS